MFEAALETQVAVPGKVALVVNEAARSFDASLLATRLRELVPHVEWFGIDDVQRAAASGADRLVVAGGDGSIAQAAATAGATGLPLALVPAGTANDFARRLGLPLELETACRLAVCGTRLCALELGWMEPLNAAGQPRPFVNVASAGLPAPAARTAHAWKRLLGPLAYAAGALAAGLTSRPIRCQVVCDEYELFAGSTWQVTVAASGGFGAGARVAEADPADGALEVVAVGASARPGLIGLAYRLRRGTVAQHRQARHARCRRAELHLESEVAYNVDGEVVRFGPARFTGQRSAFRLVVA